MKRSNEPFWWSLFSAGGVVAAVLTPIFVLLTGIAGPLGWLPAGALDYDKVHRLVSHPLSKLVLLALIALSLFHWAHRFRFTLFDLGIRGGRAPVAVLCYGSAIVGTITTIVVLCKI